MKTLNNILIYIFIVSFYLISCESDNVTINNDPVFSIKFSDSTVVNEKDIVFYDSSTCILFLKNKLTLTIGPEDPPYSFIEFSVLVDDEIIYQGIIYPDMLFVAPCPIELYISADTYPNFNNDIIQLKYDKNILNDPRIIKSLEKSNLLHHGITCIIDSVKVFSYNDSSVMCSITLRNYDDINYYILDPERMGVSSFNCYTTGLVLSNLTTHNSHTPIHSNSLSDCNILVLDDLSILMGKSEITYTYKSSYYPRIDKGIYKGHLRFSSMIDRPVTLSLDQENGRVWVGKIFSTLDSIIFE